MILLDRKECGPKMESESSNHSLLSHDLPGILQKHLPGVRGYLAPPQSMIR